MSVGSETTLFVGVFVLPGRLETILTFSGYFCDQIFGFFILGLDCHFPPI